MYRRGGLSRELTAPTGAKTTTKLHALWGRVRDVEGPQLLVAGDADDYGPQAEELALSRCGVRAVDARARNVLRLLSALEDSNRFEKRAGRLTTADDRGAVASWREAEATRRRDEALTDATTLQNLELALADADGASPGAVSAAEARLEALREEAAAEKQKREVDAAAKREAKAKKRRLLADADSLLQAACDDAAAAGDDDDDEYDPAEPAVKNGGAAPTLAGRGRGVSNLPAWMTPGGPGAASESGAASSGAASSGAASPPPTSWGVPLSPPPNNGAPPALAGRGRGVSNLPAWMSGDGAPAVVETTKRARDDDDAVPPPKRAKASRADLRASLVDLARSDPDGFDSLIAEVWVEVGT